MGRLAFRLTLLLLLAFAVAIGLVRAQTYDAGDVRAFFTPPDGCPAPCWLGIRPGVTTLGEAYRIFNDLPWIQRVEPWASTTYVLWWSRERPAVLNPDAPGILSVQNGVIQRISLPTTASFADFWLLYNQPRRGGFFCLGRSWRGVVIHFASYPDAGFSTSLRPPLAARCLPNTDRSVCPLPFETFWKSRVEVILGPVYVDLTDYAAIRSRRPPVCIV